MDAGDFVEMGGEYRCDALLGPGLVSQIRRENVDVVMVVLYNNISALEEVPCTTRQWTDWSKKVARRRPLYAKQGV